MAHHIISTSTRSSITRSELVSPPAALCQAIKRYSQKKDDNHAIGEKAKSTAEEFSRVAKEKAESATRTAKNTWEGTKETAKEVVGGKPKLESTKEKYKETIEKGSYDKIGQEE